MSRAPSADRDASVFEIGDVSRIVVIRPPLHSSRPMLDILGDRIFRHLFLAQIVALLGTGLAVTNMTNNRESSRVALIQTRVHKLTSMM